MFSAVALIAGEVIRCALEPGWAYTSRCLLNHVGDAASHPGAWCPAHGNDTRARTLGYHTGAPAHRALAGAPFMVFASPVFLLLFLPVVFAAYAIAPRAARNPVLLVASLVFYVWGEGWFVSLVLTSVLVNWGFGLAIGHTDDPARRRRWLTAAVAVNLTTLAVFKYANFAVENLSSVAMTVGRHPIEWNDIPLPLGISFFTFHAISYVVDVYKRNAKAERRLFDFALYILLFPQLIAGPIIRWRDFTDQIGGRDWRRADVAYGLRRLLLGLGKKVLIANTLGRVADPIFDLPSRQLPTALAWLGLVCYTLQIYFDFSGYSDMALGLMRMFGFRILENFNYPYISRSIREFWRRWHISLSNWFLDYLYVPLGGNREGVARGYRNLVIVFLLCGLWHGASWPFILWGIWHGLFLVEERVELRRLLEKLGPLAHVYTMLVVMGGWVLFRCDTLDRALAFYTALLGLGNGDPMQRPVLEFLDPLVATTIVVAVVGATPAAKRLGTWLEQRATASPQMGTVVLAADTAWLVFVLIAATAFLAAGTYNPFIYFRF
jgi:alginate O-acetyltransferase complex protein AlgI